MLKINKTKNKQKLILTSRCTFCEVADPLPGPQTVTASNGALTVCGPQSPRVARYLVAALQLGGASETSFHALVAVHALPGPRLFVKITSNFLRFLFKIKKKDII